MDNFLQIQPRRLPVLRYGLLMTVMACVSITSVNADDSLNVPDGAMAYVRFDVELLRLAPELDVFEKLLSHVDTEVSMASISKLGIDVTTLRDVTVVVPAFAEAVSASEPAVCASFRFARSFRANDVRSRLGDGWKEVKVDRESMFVHEDSTCLYISSNKSMLVGSQTVIRWCINRKDDDEGFLNSIKGYAHGESDISLGVDLRDVPAELVYSLLPNAKLSFKPDYLGADISVDDGIYIYGSVYCDTNQQAVEATDLIKSFVQMGIDQLVEMEGQQKAEAQIANQSLEDTVMQLGVTALVREAIEILETIEVEDDDTIASLNVLVENGAFSTACVLLPAIGAIGATTETSSLPEAISEAEFDMNAESNVTAEREQETPSSLIESIRSGARPGQPSVR